MAELLVAYDPTKPEGERLAPEVRAEIAILAPADLPNRSVGNDQLDDGAVNERTIEDGAVNERAIGERAVTTERIDERAVTGERLALDSVRGEHVAPGGGVPTAHDSTANPISLDFMPITSADYAALVAAGTTDPNTVYLERET